MGKLTFVIEFEDGEEPAVHARMEAFGGKVVAVAFRDALVDVEQVQYSHEPLNGIRCYLCNGHHPIGVPCPLSKITSVMSNA